MRLKYQIRLLIALSAISLTIMAAILFVRIRNNDAAAKKISQTSTIIKDIISFQLLISDLENDQSDRIQAQINVVTISLEGQFARSQAYTSAENSIREKMANDYVKILEISEEIQELENLLESSSSGNSDVRQAYGQILIEQREILVQDIINQGFRLQDSVRDRLEVSQRASNGLIILMVVILISAVMVSAYRVASNFDRSKTTLRAVAENVSKGNLDYQSDTRPDDEFSAVYTAFNHMTTQIQHNIIAMQREIDTRRQAEEQLRYQASLIDNISDAIISTDMEFNIQSWNEAAEELYGWRAEEVIGKSLSDLVRPEYLDIERQVMIQQFLDAGMYRGKAIHHSKDGIPLTIFGSVTLLRNEARVQIGAVSVNRDITEQSRIEADLENHRLNLEAMVAERTEKLNKLVRSMTGREVRMSDLKKVIKALRRQILDAGMTPEADDPLLGNLDE